jgi:hypothetical protein
VSYASYGVLPTEWFIFSPLMEKMLAILLT